ncbi:MAG TPA: cupin domain-containing protein, partial [Solirubrobacteraceae bacterium]|nr:cupin domain-containing protein [Solirubrobacteraceae bacterium]
MPKEAKLTQTPGGKAPKGAGWFVLNAREARWLTGDFGAYTRFEGAERWKHLGFNIGVLEPGQPACYYHAENDQEDFLVLSGECLLLIEGQERPLKAWDFVHCPPWTE